MDLSIKQVEYLKCLLDDAILENCPEFEYPCYFSYTDITREEMRDLERKELIGWHDGYNITNEGEKAYHANKHRLSYHKGDSFHRGDITDTELEEEMLEDFLHTLAPEIKDALKSRGVTKNKDLRQFKMVLDINGEEVPVITVTKEDNLVRCIMHQWDKKEKYGVRIMKHKGYSARVAYSNEDSCYVGEITNIDHSASFHGNTILETRKAFHEMVHFIEEQKDKENKNA